MIEVEYEDPFDKGKTCHDQARDAIAFAQSKRDTDNRPARGWWHEREVCVRFKFNDIRLCAYSNSCVEDIVEKYIMGIDTPTPAENIDEPAFSSLIHACWTQSAPMFKLLNTKTREFVGPGKNGRVWKRKGDFANSLSVNAKFAKSVAQDHVLVEMQLVAKHVWPVETFVKGIQDRAAERERVYRERERAYQEQRDREEYERLAKKFAKKS